MRWILRLRNNHPNLIIHEIQSIVIGNIEQLHPLIISVDTDEKDIDRIIRTSGTVIYTIRPYFV